MSTIAEIACLASYNAGRFCLYFGRALSYISGHAAAMVAAGNREYLAMAKVSAHGSIIGTVEYLTHAKRYMSDGVILKNIGFGWKIHGKVKPGIAPTSAYESARDRLAARIAELPAAAAYLRALHELAGVSKRWKLHAAVTLMPDDADGVWSEACDGYGDNVHADLDDIAELCRLYQAAKAVRGASADV